MVDRIVTPNLYDFDFRWVVWLFAITTSAGPVGCFDGVMNSAVTEAGVFDARPCDDNIAVAHATLLMR